MIPNLKRRLKWMTSTLIIMIFFFKYEVDKALNPLEITLKGQSLNKNKKEIL